MPFHHRAQLVGNGGEHGILFSGIIEYLFYDLYLCARPLLQLPGMLFHVAFE